MALVKIPFRGREIAVEIPDRKLCWFCGRPGRARSQRSTGYFECTSCDVQWYGGDTPLPLSNGQGRR